MFNVERGDFQLDIWSFFDGDLYNSFADDCFHWMGLPIDRSGRWGRVRRETSMRNWYRGLDALLSGIPPLLPDLQSSHLRDTKWGVLLHSHWQLDEDQSSTKITSWIYSEQQDHYKTLSSVLSFNQYCLNLCSVVTFAFCLFCVCGLRSFMWVGICVWMSVLCIFKCAPSNLWQNLAWISSNLKKKYASQSSSKSVWVSNNETNLSINFEHIYRLQPLRLWIVIKLIRYK